MRRRHRAFRGDKPDALFARFRAASLPRIGELRERAFAAFVVEVAASPLAFAEARDERCNVYAGTAELGGDESADEFRHADAELRDMSPHGFFHFGRHRDAKCSASSHSMNHGAASPAAQLFLRGADAAQKRRKVLTSSPTKILFDVNEYEDNEEDVNHRRRRRGA